MEQTADLEPYGPAAQVTGWVTVPLRIACPHRSIVVGWFARAPGPHLTAVELAGSSRRQQITPAAASRAASTVQPERLRDGSLLFRFASGQDAADGHASNGLVLQSHDQAATHEPNGNGKEVLNGHAGPAAAVPSNGQVSSANRQDRGTRLASGRAGGRTAPGKRSTAEGAARASSGGRQPCAGPRNGAGQSIASAQRGAPAQRQRSAATALRETSAGQDARGAVAGPRPSFMDIPPPQQQYRTATMFSPHIGGGESSGEEDDETTHSSSRSGWSGKRRPQRVRFSCAQYYPVPASWPAALLNISMLHGSRSSRVGALQSDLTSLCLGIRLLS